MSLRVQSSTLNVKLITTTRLLTVKPIRVAAQQDVLHWSIWNPRVMRDAIELLASQSLYSKKRGKISYHVPVAIIPIVLTGVWQNIFISLVHSLYF